MVSLPCLWYEVGEMKHTVLIKHVCDIYDMKHICDGHKWFIAIHVCRLTFFFLYKPIARLGNIKSKHAWKYLYLHSTKMTTQLVQDEYRWYRVSKKSPTSLRSFVSPKNQILFWFVFIYQEITNVVKFGTEIILRVFSF